MYGRIITRLVVPETVIDYVIYQVDKIVRKDTHYSILNKLYVTGDLVPEKGGDLLSLFSYN